MEEISLAYEIRSCFPNLTVLENEPMRAHCAFRIGGPAAVFAEPEFEMELAALCRFLRERGVRPTVIGNGSNLLVRDEGIPGVVIRLGERFGSLRAEGTRIYAEAGVPLARLAVFAKEHGLAGLEFAHGIPGTLGGAIMMNAGAYGGEMKDVVKSVRYMNEFGNTAETDDPGFAYRKSRFSGSGDIILGACMELREDDPAAIHARMMELWAKRSASQPLDMPSAGSTFKRPVGGFAAALIEQAGLKGLAVGGAQVSEKHSGFIVNTGGATCADVLELMEQVKRAVYENSGVRLEPEVRLLG